MRKMKPRYLLFVCFLVFSIYSLKAQGGEHILNFHSDIRIDTTRKILITENIKINVTGASIKRGIVRTIPIYRKDKYNIDRRIDIYIESVLRDGVTENFSTKNENKNFAIYIGKESETLAPGIYTYTITYSSRGHLGFYHDYDEIYWNVNGNDWDFGIDSISATVYLPHGAKMITNACYTGELKSTDTNCTYQSIGDTIVQFYGSTSLFPGEGLTIATSFTPHVVTRPAPLSKFQSYLFDKGMQYMLLVGVLIYALFLILFRLKTNTSSKQIVVPSFDPPGNKSAGAIRYLYKRKVDSKAITASILSMVTKKAVAIKKANSSYTLTPLEDTSELTEDEKDLYNQLFFTRNSYYSDLKSILNLVLQKKINLNNYFRNKDKYTVTSSIVCLVLLVVWYLIGLFFLGIRYDNLIFVTMFPSMVMSTYFVRNNKFIFILLLLFSIVLFVVQLVFFNENFFYKYSSIFGWILIALDLLYMTSIDPKTKEGETFTAELDGFKRYLSVTEENRLRVLSPSDENLDHFEKLLPYAVALDVEIQWVEKFSKKLNEINYTPSWYIGQSAMTYTDLIESIINTLKKSQFNIERSSETNNKSYTRIFKSSDTQYNDTSSGSSSSGSSGKSSGNRSNSWSSGSRGGGSSGGGGGGGGGRGW